jgi:hypothetical protein
MPAPKTKRVASPKAAKKASPRPGNARKAARKPTRIAAAKEAASKEAKPKLRAKPVAFQKPAASAVAVNPTAAPKPKAKKAVQRQGRPERRTAPTPVRRALSASAKKRAIQATLDSVVDGKAVVDAYMRDFAHPFKVEMEAVRQIVVEASSKISERIKWNAPSFFYKEDLGAFNPRATQYAHLILLFPGGAGMLEDSGLLEGNHKDRREAKFHSMQDVKAKRPALEKLVKRWVKLREEAS